MLSLEEEKKNIFIESEDLVAEYYHLESQLKQLKEKMRQTINQPIHALPFLQPGRLVHIRDHEEDWGWGVIVNFQKKQHPGNSKNGDENGSDIGTSYVVDVLLSCDASTASSVSSTQRPRPARPDSTKTEVQVVPVMLHLFDGVSSIRYFHPLYGSSARS